MVFFFFLLGIGVIFNFVGSVAPISDSMNGPPEYEGG